MNNKKLLPLLAAVLCAASVIAMLAALAAPRKVVREPFTPPPFESAAVEGIPEVPENLGWRELDADVFRMSVCGVLIPTENSVDVWFTSHEDNHAWLKLRVLDESGEILGETGLLRPGEYVRAVALNEVPEGGTAVKLKIMAYEPETYHSMGSAELSTTIRGGTP